MPGFFQYFQWTKETGVLKLIYIKIPKQGSRSRKKSLRYLCILANDATHFIA
jgi:hypothetical protein